MALAKFVHARKYLLIICWGTRGDDTEKAMRSTGRRTNPQSESLRLFILPAPSPSGDLNRAAIDPCS